MAENPRHDLASDSPAAAHLNDRKLIVDQAAALVALLAWLASGGNSASCPNALCLSLPLLWWC